MKQKLILFLSFIAFFIACQPEWVKKAPSYDYTGMDEQTRELHRSVEEFLWFSAQNEYPVAVPLGTRIDSIRIDAQARHIQIDLNKAFSFLPFREDNVRDIYSELRKTIDDYDNYSIVLRSLGHPIEQLIPNYYREESAIDSSRIGAQEKQPSLVYNLSRDLVFGKGLSGNHVALWHSHGWYYNADMDRWLWQRARLFGVVEDLLPASFVLPYLLPMLENAGANAFVPRERDLQTHAVIIDNDSLQSGHPAGGYRENRYENGKLWQNAPGPGYAIGSPPYPVNFNPFRSGSARLVQSDSVESASIDYIPAIPDSGWYAVYVSYPAHPQNIPDARYTVHHNGGKTVFRVNQQMGGGTWIYLGTFHFARGFNPQQGRVHLSNESNTVGGAVAADAVKFGGGMGSVLRNDRSSGRPQFVEGSRYWLQTAGFPDTLVYNLNDNSDYRDDYQSRGEWVNYMQGAPGGPNVDRDVPGLKIPIDASLAFHTDAGVTVQDTTIGTLLIYSLTGSEGEENFPNGVSRLASRDFSDILQTQLTEDLRALYDPIWRRRALREAQYSEAFRPNVPAALLELLSHQNFFDMRFALDPKFRFDASRSIYKALLRFIAGQEGRDYIVQPLPPDHFSALFDEDSTLRLSWKPVTDPLEPSAEAKSYRVYSRVEDGGWDNGVRADSAGLVISDLEPDVLYSFKVTALNEGGESFPSEVLSVCRVPDKPTLLVVNGFDRVAAPQVINENNFQGFAYFLDNGVPDKYDLGHVGEQFNFWRDQPWQSDDRPGHGASYADVETQVFAGNRFEYPYVHGRAIREAGYGFVSVSDEAFQSSSFDASGYPVIDLILGEEKETRHVRAEMDSLYGASYKTFPEQMKRALRNYLAGGGNLFVSGAYIASDLFARAKQPYPDPLFATEILRYFWVTNHAVKTGGVVPAHGTDSLIVLPGKFAFNTDYDAEIYRVEAPDAIGPANGARTILRYEENGFSAATAYKNEYGIVAFGFPFETIKGQHQRNAVMKGVLDFLMR